eukprot:GHVN01064598.1.p1 GENE.GHVN01064598.1~~GHVN01064598.1.p1  ORF type:complete len:111 (+),score=11.88 GHVN01064598.1:111-443(+)
MPRINEHLSEEKKNEVTNVLQEYKEPWVEPKLAQYVLPPFKLELTGEPVCAKPRRFTPEEEKIIKDQFGNLVKMGVMRPTASPWGAAIVLVNKLKEIDIQCQGSWTCWSQ